MLTITKTTLVDGDEYAPLHSDLLAQTAKLPVGEEIPEGWRVLSGNNETSLLARVVMRHEIEGGCRNEDEPDEETLAAFGQMGMEHWDQGGGCTAFGRNLVGSDNAFLLITDGDCDGYAPTNPTTKFLIGVYSDDLPDGEYATVNVESVRGFDEIANRVMRAATSLISEALGPRELA